MNVSLCERFDLAQATDQNNNDSVSKYYTIHHIANDEWRRLGAESDSHI